MSDVTLAVGGHARFSNYYLQILRGNYRKTAEGQIFEVMFLNDVSIKVRPVGSVHPYGTQYSRRYLVAAEVIVTSDQDLYCRFCLRLITKDSEGAIQDIDPVTNENAGFRHEGCQPNL